MTDRVSWGPAATASPRGDATIALAGALATLVAVAASVGWKLANIDLPVAYTRAGYSDIPALFGARGLDAGIPWVDAPLEYPPGIGLVAWGAASVTNTARSFLVVTGIVLALCGATATWLLVREVGWPRPVALLAGPMVWFGAAINWDLVTVALAVAGLVAHRRGRDGWAGMWLGLGVATKLWPGLLLLAVVPAAWRLRGRGAAVRTTATAAAAWAVLNVPVMVASLEGWRLFLDLNRERVADWDSLWRLVGTRVGIDPSVPTLNLWVAVLTTVGVAAVLAATMWHLPAREWHRSGFALVAVFLLVGKVWSPQFTLWLLPLAVLAWPGWPLVVALTVADAAVHVTRFRWLANFVADGLPGAWPEWPFLTAVLVRDLVVVLMVAAWWRGARSMTVRSDGRKGSRARPARSQPDGTWSAAAGGATWRQ